MHPTTYWTGWNVIRGFHSSVITPLFFPTTFTIVLRPQGDKSYKKPAEPSPGTRCSSNSPWCTMLVHTSGGHGGSWCQVNMWRMQSSGVKNGEAAEATRTSTGASASPQEV